MLLIMYRILVLTVHQLLVYQRLFRRRAAEGVDSQSSTLNRLIMERITLQHLQHVRGVTSQIFNTMEIPSIFWRKVLANLPFHVRDLLVSTCSNQIKVTEKC
jgi:hypothetical protein